MYNTMVYFHKGCSLVVCRNAGTCMTTCSSKTASGAGEVRIHWMTRWPSYHLSSTHTLSGLLQMAEFEGSTSRLMFGMTRIRTCMWRQSLHGGSCMAGFDLALLVCHRRVGSAVHFVNGGSCRIQVAGKQLYFVKQLFRNFPGLNKLAESLLVCAVIFPQFQGAHAASPGL